jgi:hypothetical protein
MDKNKYDWVFWTEWISTAVLICGVTLTAFNIYPTNLYLNLLGNFGWAIVSIAWRKWSLLVIQGVVSIIYIVGVYSTL